MSTMEMSRVKVDWKLTFTALFTLASHSLEAELDAWRHFFYDGDGSEKQRLTSY